jgi:hypothetical protein
MTSKDVFGAALVFALGVLSLLVWVFYDIYQWLWSGV